MKKVFFKKFLMPIIAAFSTLHYTSSLSFASRFSSNDPYPLYAASNPLAPFTAWQDCQGEQFPRFSVSLYRQSADKGRGDLATAGSCSNACAKDLEIGDINGQWNMLALFYPEKNNDNTIKNALIDALEITPDEIAACFTEATTDLSDPKNSDLKKEFGFFSVPIAYRKNGVRFEFDLKFCWDFGIKLQSGVASIRQDAYFNDLTCKSTGTTCTASDGTLALHAFNKECKELVITKIMQKKDIIAETLELDIRDFCKTELEDLVVHAYWSHCFEFNKHSSTEPCNNFARYTFTPYIVGGISIPVTKEQEMARLFSLPFGNNKHYAYHANGGFTINFLETVLIGIEAGFTKFSEKLYANMPVPTHNVQAGMFPRKADLCIEPGTNWTFGATLGACDFIENLSSTIQFRVIHHCKNHITALKTQPLKNQTAFPVSNILLDKMKEESEWLSSFVNVNFDYTLSPSMALGLFWQIPVRQSRAYRPTTIMGSLTFKH